MNMWTKRRIKPSQLLRQKRTMIDVANFKSADDLEAYLAKKREAVN